MTKAILLCSYVIISVSSCIYGLLAFGKFFLRDTVSSPEWERELHLERSGSKSQCPLTALAKYCGVMLC